MASTRRCCASRRRSRRRRRGSSSGLGGLWNRYVWLVDVQDENDELRDDNQRLRRELAQARRAAADTQALEDLVRLRRRTQSETVGARVICVQHQPVPAGGQRSGSTAARARSRPACRSSTSTVWSAWISRVYGRYSDVMLVTNSQSSDRRDRAAHRRPRLAHRSGARRRLPLQDRVLERGKPVQVGDPVVTWGWARCPPASRWAASPRSTPSSTRCTRGSRSIRWSTSARCRGCWWCWRRRRRRIPTVTSRLGLAPPPGSGHIEVMRAAAAHRPVRGA